MDCHKNTDRKMSSHKNVGNKRECIDVLDNPYAEFCTMAPSPRKKLRTMEWTDASDSEQDKSNDTNDDIPANVRISPSAESMDQDTVQPQNVSSVCDEKEGNINSTGKNYWQPETLHVAQKTEFKKTKQHGNTGYLCQGPGCHEEFKSLAEHDVHYRSRHCNVCTECKRSLKSRHLLDLHLMEKHDSYFAAVSLKKPSFLCLIESCSQLFMNPEERRVHCINEHPYLKKFLQNASDSKIIAVEAFSSEEQKVPVKVKKPHAVDKMEEDVPLKEELASTKKLLTPKTEGTPQIVPEKKKPVHISFGHHGARFIPRQVFAMQKKPNAEKKSTMDTVDLSDLQQSLQC